MDTVYLVALDLDTPPIHAFRERQSAMDLIEIRILGHEKEGYRVNKRFLDQTTDLLTIQLVKEEEIGKSVITMMVYPVTVQ